MFLSLDIKITKQELADDIVEKIETIDDKQDVLPDKTNNAGKVLAVNQDEDGFEYIIPVVDSTPLASEVVIIDEGSYYDSDNVEGALQEIAVKKEDRLPNKSSNAGRILAVNQDEDGFEYIEMVITSTPTASEVSIVDIGDYYDSDNVEDALQEIAVKKQNTLPSLADNAGKVLTVNETEDGFIYVKPEEIPATPVLPEHVGIRNIVFMVGDDLLTGGQEHTELYIPLTGNIKKIYISVGMASTHNTNLQVALQRFVGTSWSNLSTITVSIEERLKITEVDLPIENNRLRINLVSGNFENVANLSVIAELHI
jgi:tRNA(Ser,Leu) C12 N-acetylase TAN1